MGQKQVLVVEDSRMFSRVIRGKICSKLGFDCKVASSFSEARGLLNEKDAEFFVAVVDLGLPDADEEQVVDYVLARQIPVIVFTANFNEETRSRILSKDIVDYVLKESVHDVDYLVRAVERIYKNQSVKVLVVDDSGVTRNMLRMLLETQKLIVLEAEDGEEGLEMLKKYPEIKLAIVDYGLPEMDGSQFVYQVRKNFSPDKLAIIGISSSGSSLLSAKFLKRGANDFLYKPFAKEEFYCRVNQNIDMLNHIQTIRDASHKDYLTSLYNRRYFFDLGNKIFENARQGNLDITVAMIDIDRFKRINDTYGHDSGDSALMRVTELIARERKTSDVVARFGGDEFCVLTVNMAPEAIYETFEGIRRCIEEERICSENSEFSITVSIGVTTQLGPTLEATVSMADELMYLAKQQGRNKLIVK